MTHIQRHKLRSFTGVRYGALALVGTLVASFLLVGPRVLAAEPDKDNTISRFESRLSPATRALIKHSSANSWYIDAKVPNKAAVAAEIRQALYTTARLQNTNTVHPNNCVGCGSHTTSSSRTRAVGGDTLQVSNTFSNNVKTSGGGLHVDVNGQGTDYLWGSTPFYADSITPSQLISADGLAISISVSWPPGAGFGTSTSSASWSGPTQPHCWIDGLNYAPGDISFDGLVFFGFHQSDTAVFQLNGRGYVTSTTANFSN